MFSAKVSFSIGPEQRKGFIGFEFDADGTVQAAHLETNGDIHQNLIPAASTVEWPGSR